MHTQFTILSPGIEATVAEARRLRADQMRKMFARVFAKRHLVAAHA